MKTLNLSAVRSLTALTTVLGLCSASAQFPTNPPPAPVITVHVMDGDAGEPNNPGLLRLFRSGPTNDTLQVTLAIGGNASNGVDYVVLPASMVIPAGQREAVMPVNPIDDPQVEPLESVQVRLLRSPIGAPLYVVGNPSNAVVTIRDNDLPPPPNRPPFVELVSPMDNSVFLVPINVHLAAKTGDPDPGDYVASIHFYSGTNLLGADFAPPFGLVWSNVPPGRYELRAVARDTQGAMAHSQPVHISVVTNLPPPPTNLLTVVSIQALDGIAAEGTNSVRWTNFCSQPFTNFCGTNVIQREGTNIARFIVRRHGPTNNALIVHYRTGGMASNGVDYAQLPGLVEIPAGRRGVEILLVPIDDLKPEPLENVVLGLRPPPTWPSNTPPPYVIGTPARAAAVIVDNDGLRPPHHLFPDRCFHLVHPGTNGTWVRIEYSIDMIHWSAIGTQQVSDGAVHFVDPEGDTRPNTFYRVVPSLPPPPED